MSRRSLPLQALIALSLILLAGCGSSSNTTTRNAAAGTTTTSGSAASSTASTSSTHSTTTSTSAKRPSPHAFAAGKITHSAASALARTGEIILPVATGGPGEVRAFGQAEIPGAGIVHVATSRPATATRAGVVKLTLVLTSLARAQLAKGRSIDMFVAVQFSNNHEAMQREEVLLRP